MTGTLLWMGLAAGVLALWGVALRAGRDLTRMRAVLDQRDREITFLLRLLRRAEDLNGDLERSLGIDWALSDTIHFPPPSFEVAAEQAVRLARPGAGTDQDTHEGGGDRP